MTSLLVSGEESPIKCGAVLSPITDFELYGKRKFFHLYAQPREAVVSAPLSKQIQCLRIIIRAVRKHSKGGKNKG